MLGVAEEVSNVVEVEEVAHVAGDDVVGEDGVV
jgi:hypothetical protein